MKKRLLIGYAVAAVALLLAFEYAFWSNGFRYLEKQSESAYLAQAELLGDVFLAEHVASRGAFGEFADACSKEYNVRITVIDEDGSVVGESGKAEQSMDNHRDRQEVERALKGEGNSVIRRSDTFGLDYCYSAVPVEGDGFRGVLRVAVPMEELRNMNDEFFRSTAQALAILLLLVISLAMYFRKYISAMKKVEDMRKDFVANVTHELKTPLTSIQGFVETLKSGALEDPDCAGRFLDIIEIETERLKSLIDDVLLLSEIESGSKRGEERKPWDVNEIASEVAELLTPKVKEHVRLIFHPDSSVRPYPCSRDHMKQLLINLVDNGLKATEFGAVTISCKSREGRLELEVSDTGIGMEEEELQRIFERFYRVEKSRSRAEGGTGLGLSIVKHIVELYRGTIEVDSKPGAGSVFRVQLPY